MKKIFLLPLSLAFYGACAQNNSIDLKPEIGQYLWNDVVSMTPCMLNGKTITGASVEPVLSVVGQDFHVVDVLVTAGTNTAAARREAIIVIDVYNDEADGFATYNVIKSKEFDTWRGTHKNSQSFDKFQRYFKVDVSFLQAHAVKYSHISGALVGGVLSFPFKLRLQSTANDFSSAFNIGAAMGYNFPHYDYRHFTYSALFAATTTTINLDASSVTMNADKLVASNNFSALSLAVGVMVEYEHFQVGAFIGIDRLGKINNDTYNWLYQNKPWISVGFGYSLFSVQKQSAGDKTNKN